VRAQAVAAIGLSQLLAAMPAEWWPILERHLDQYKREVAAQTITLTTTAVSPPVIPPDLDIRNSFFDRRVPKDGAAT
jgi:hypothetical protein